MVERERLDEYAHGGRFGHVRRARKGNVRSEGNVVFANGGVNVARGAKSTIRLIGGRFRFGWITPYAGFTRRAGRGSTQPETPDQLEIKMEKSAMRPSGRAPEDMRRVSLEPGTVKYAEGSCLARFGDTHVLCAATIEERVPFFLRNSGRGWVTAEYGMLPRATHTRTAREAARGKQSGRTFEIQRLIGRSLRAVTDLAAMGERQIRIDCDVLQADGGTRTAAITGAWVALHQAFSGLVAAGDLKAVPLTDQVAAVSCGLYRGAAVCDLDYAEDSNAEADANFVLTASGAVVEVQCTAEEAPFGRDAFDVLFGLAEHAVADLVVAQRQALSLEK